MSETIFLQVGSDNRIPFGAFVESLRNFLSVLKDIDATISHNPQGHLVWEVVSLQKNSPAVIGVAPKLRRPQYSNVSEVVEEQLITNTRLLSFKGERNEYLSDAALTKIENLAKLTPKLGAIEIYLNGDGTKKSKADITQKTLDNVNQLTKVKYHAFGSIVGNLDAISVHKGNEFRVWDEITKKSVRCAFDEKDIEQVKSMLKSRVVVFGDVQSNSSGSPVVISVEELEPYPQKELPSIEEMSGFIENFTEGKSLKEYMEALSNE